MGQPFKIFHLPSLAQDVVFGQMILEEILNLSKCSKKSHTTMRGFTQRRTYTSSISLCYYRHFEISAQKGWEGHKFERTEDGDDVLKRILIYEFLHLFRPATSINVHFVSDLEWFTRLSEKLNLQLDTVRVDEICCLKRNDELYKLALRVFKSASVLEFYAVPPPNFIFVDIPKFTCNSIDIGPSCWVTLCNIFNGFMDCKAVYLRDCSIQSDAIHLVVQRWLEGSRLEEIVLYPSGERVQNYSLETIFKDIPYREVKRVRYSSKFKSEPTYINQKVFNVGYLIQRSDGIGAVISWDKTQFVMGTNYEINVRTLQGG